MISAWRPKEGKWPLPPGPWGAAAGTGCPPGTCPLCWQTLPLPHCGLRKRGALRAAEGPDEAVDNSPEPAGFCLGRSVAVQRRGTRECLECVCIQGVCVQGVCVPGDWRSADTAVNVLDGAHGHVCIFAVRTGDCVVGAGHPTEGEAGLRGQCHSSGAGQPKAARSPGGQAPGLAQGPKPQLWNLLPPPEAAPCPGGSWEIRGRP